MATRGELVSTQMPKKSWVENWLHECQLLASVTLPLGSTVAMCDCSIRIFYCTVTVLLEYFDLFHTNIVRSSCSMFKKANLATFMLE